jgi:hypothetical protein
MEIRTRILLALLIVGGTAQVADWVSIGKGESDTGVKRNISSKLRA